MNGRLDREELLHLALYSMQREAPEDALRQLKALLEQAPDDANAHFLLGGCYADIGLYDRAVEALQAALDADASLHTARFQLGLLHLTSGRIADAESTWLALEALGPESPLNRFQSALRHLAHDEISASISEFEAGLQLDSGNPDLEQDMQRILSRVREAGAESTDGEPATASDGPEGVGDAAPDHPVFLAAYHRHGTGKPSG